MKITAEQLAKMKEAKSAEELIALAKSEGIEATEEEAAKYFSELHKDRELSDEELDNVSGGVFIQTITVYTFYFGECFRCDFGSRHVIYKVREMQTSLKSNESVYCDEYYPGDNGGYVLKYTNSPINAGLLVECEELPRNYV